MSRYDAMFERARERREGVFGGFLMLGDPDRARSDLLLDALVEGGADMVELGIPFSDPIADGPVIEAAANRALAAGIRTADCFAMIADFRARHPEIPVGILTYANLVSARGREAFARELAAAGADSLLVADVPLFEAGPYLSAARDAGIAPVLIAAGNAPDERLREIARRGGGYTYCLARAGVTGEREGIDLDHGPMLALLKAAGAPPPILGFGSRRKRRPAGRVARFRRPNEGGDAARLTPIQRPRAAEDFSACTESPYRLVRRHVSSY
ncbi:MAG: tryptophan synthase subunit alpha [Sphingomonadales bacterium]|nr:tryptophan synthase subunit alpha [Sphingomonadales bacterium]